MLKELPSSAWEYVYPATKDNTWGAGPVSRGKAFGNENVQFYDPTEKPIPKVFHLELTRSAAHNALMRLGSMVSAAFLRLPLWKASAGRCLGSCGAFRQWHAIKVSGLMQRGD
jgi:hypothetical protein